MVPELLATQRGAAKKKLKKHLFVQHCFNHRLVVASRAGQQHIPRDVEDTISDILKYSAVYTSRLQALLELAEDRYRRVVAYNKDGCQCINALIDRWSCIQNSFNIFMMHLKILAGELQ